MAGSLGQWVICLQTWRAGLATLVRLRGVLAPSLMMTTEVGSMLKMSSREMTLSRKSEKEKLSLVGY